MNAFLVFKHHPKFIHELEDFINGHCPGRTTSDQTIEYIQNLLSKHFCLKSPSFTSKHLGSAQGFEGYTVFWLHLIIPNSGLTRTQNPKSYFYKTDSLLCFLCMDSHIENYKDDKLRNIAKERLNEMIVVLNQNVL